MNRIYDSRAHQQCELVFFFSNVFYINLLPARQRLGSCIKILSYYIVIPLCTIKSFATFSVFYALLIGNTSTHIRTDCYAIICKNYIITRHTHSSEKFQYYRHIFIRINTLYIIHLYVTVFQ